jgi:Trk-type K+ transport system membrane component
MQQRKEIELVGSVFMILGGIGFGENFEINVEEGSMKRVRRIWIPKSVFLWLTNASVNLHRVDRSQDFPDAH